MSKFLAPIHFWLFNKIKIQNDMVNTVLELNENKNWVAGLKEEIKSTIGELETEDLEQIIDQSNIHGWLQERVSLVERRLAFTVTKILKADADAMEEIAKAVFDLGLKYNDGESHTIKEWFSILESSLLDGMPCDHVNVLIHETENEIVWRRTQCIHACYWKQFDGDAENYYKIRSAFISGMLCNTEYVFVINQDISEITKNI